MASILTKKISKLVKRLSLTVRWWLRDLTTLQNSHQDVFQKPQKGTLDPTALAFKLRDQERAKNANR